MRNQMVWGCDRALLPGARAGVAGAGRAAAATGAGAAQGQRRRQLQHHHGHALPAALAGCTFRCAVLQASNSRFAQTLSSSSRICCVKVSNASVPLHIIGLLAIRSIAFKIHVFCCLGVAGPSRSRLFWQRVPAAPVQAHLASGR